MKRLFAVLVALVALTNCAATQARPRPPRDIPEWRWGRPVPKTMTIQVRVTCGDTPIEGAEVYVDLPTGNVSGKTGTDATARFTVPLQTGTAQLHVNAVPPCGREDRLITLNSNAVVVNVTLPYTPPLPNAGERGRVRVEGTRFLREDGSLFDWRGFSDFSLFQRFWRGEDIGPIVEERIKLGVNVLRVFGMYVGDPSGPCGAPGIQCGIGNVNGMGPLVVSHDYYHALAAFADYLAGRGMRFEFVLLADAQILMPSAAAQVEHIRLVQEALASKWNVFYETANEPHKNGVDVRRIIPQPTAPRATGDSDVINGRINPVLEYVTIHTERKDEWVRTPRACGEIRDGADQLEAVRRPVVSDEPTGFAEEQRGDTRSDNADDAAFYAGTARQFCAGVTFHSNSGIESRLLGPKQMEIAQAWFWALSWVPAEAQFAMYQRGGAGGGPGIGDMPIEHFDLGENGTGALRTYNKHVSGFEYSIALRPEANWTARPRRGCVIVEQPRRGFVKLQCPGPLVAGARTTPVKPWRSAGIVGTVLAWQWIPNDVHPAVPAATVIGLTFSKRPTWQVAAGFAGAALAYQGPQWAKLPVWAAAQEYILLEVLTPELKGWAPLAFGAMHLPSPTLALGTAGLAWVEIKIYRKTRSLTLAMLIHAGATVLASQLPRKYTNGLQTGR